MGILCILIPILIGLICALLGYLLGRLIEKKSKVYTRLRADLDACRQEKQLLQTENSSLEREIADLRKKPGSRQPDTAKAMVNADDTSAKLNVVPSAFDAALAKSVFGKKIVENDLKIIEGIGPKIEELFKNAGIKTWQALSETPVEKCQDILDKAGPRYRIHTPASWPNQSKMAFLGKWSELKKWQDEAIGGKV
jgi:predicted flap endonuclease-1-like 5' DNA nuclease